MEDAINWALNVGSHYPDLMCLMVGSLSGYLLTVVLELWFLPTVTEPDAKRRQQGYTFLFYWLMATGASSIMWWAIDPVDQFHVRLVVSLVVSVFGFFGYPMIARALSAKYPSIGSAWNGHTQ